MKQKFTPPPNNCTIFFLLAYLCCKSHPKLSLGFQSHQQAVVKHVLSGLEVSLQHPRLHYWACGPYRICYLILHSGVCWPLHDSTEIFFHAQLSFQAMCYPASDHFFNCSGLFSLPQIHYKLPPPPPAQVTSVLAASYSGVTLKVHCHPWGLTFNVSM